MANIKKIKEGTATIYPATIPQAVVDPTSGKTVRTELDQLAGDMVSITCSIQGYVLGTGEVITTSNPLATWRRSDYLPINILDVRRITLTADPDSGHVSTVAFFDKDKTYIGGDWHAITTVEQFKTLVSQYPTAMYVIFSRRTVNKDQLIVGLPIMQKLSDEINDYIKILKTDDFVIGYDYGEYLPGGAALTLVNPNLFRLRENKTINIQFTLEKYVFVSIYLFDANENRIGRYDFGEDPLPVINGQYYKLLKPNVSNVITINDSSAVYCRITLINSRSPIGITIDPFSSNFKVNIVHVAETKNDKYSESDSFTTPLINDSQFFIGRFVQNNTGIISIDENTASSINSYPVKSDKVTLICENTTSFFWVKIMCYDVNLVELTSIAANYLPSNTAKTYKLTEGTKYININVFNSTSPSSLAYITFPTSFKLKAFDGEPLSYNVNISNTIVVAKSGGNFTSINDAVQSAKENDVILVYPGVYEETIRGFSKVVNIVGINKEKCIVQTNTNERTNPPAELSAGYIKNISFIATTLNSVNPIETTPRNLCAYGVHIDNDFSQGKKLIFENCNIISYGAPGVGIGLRPNFLLKFKDCLIQQLLDFDLYPTAQDIGALFMHESATPDTAGYNQVMEVINCRVYGSGGFSLWLSGDHSDTPTDRSATLVSINSHYWSKKSGANSFGSRTTIVPPAIAGSNIFLDPQSYGNNMTLLNG